MVHNGSISGESDQRERADVVNGVSARLEWGRLLCGATEYEKLNHAQESSAICESAHLLRPVIGGDGTLLFATPYGVWRFVDVEALYFRQVDGSSVLLAAVMHGASNTWGGYTDVYRVYFGGILTFGAVSLLVAIIIVLLAGPRDLSRTNKRNVLALEDEQLDRVQLPEGGVVQPAGPR